jgi:hypothetical protein
MNYLNIIKSTILLGLLFAASICGAAPVQPKPNILFICLGCLGHNPLNLLIQLLQLLFDHLNRDSTVTTTVGPNA